MPSCPNYVAPFEAQLGEKYGGDNCSAVSGARAVAHGTCGATNTTGAHIRALTNEPIPDPKSPGLNLVQVAEAMDDMHVYLEVRIGAIAGAQTGQSVTWAEYERRRLGGQGCVLQGGYGPIADSPYDAGGGFRGGHAIFETVHATYDPLADGRRAGIHKYNGTVYPRDLIRRFAAALPIPLANGGLSHPKPGYVWAGFTVDVIPDYVASIRPEPGNPATFKDAAGKWYRKFALYTVVGGKVVKTESARTYGLLANCTPPKNVRLGTGYKSMVQLIDHAPGREGKYVWSGFARPGHV